MNAVAMNSGARHSTRLFSDTLLGHQVFEIPFAQYCDDLDYDGFKSMYILPTAPLGEVNFTYNQTMAQTQEGLPLPDFDYWAQGTSLMGGGQVDDQHQDGSLGGVLLVPAVAAAAEAEDAPASYSNENNTPRVQCMATSQWAREGGSPCENASVQLTPGSQKQAQLNENDMLRSGLKVSPPYSPAQVTTERPESALSAQVGLLDQRSPFEYSFEEGELSDFAFMLSQPTASLATGATAATMKSVSEFSALDRMPFTPYMIPQMKPVNPLQHCGSTAFCHLSQQKDSFVRNYLQSVETEPHITNAPYQIDTLESASILDVNKESGVARSQSQIQVNPPPWQQESGLVETNNILYDIQPPKRRSSVISTRVQDDKYSKSQKIHSYVLPQRNINKGTQAETLQCPHPGCNKAFPKLYNLKSHLVCHSDTRPHTCNLCEKAFARKHDLQRHLRTIHSANRPFECEVCYEAFPRADALRRHRIVERGATVGLQKKRGGCTPVGKKRSSGELQLHCQNQSHEKIVSLQIRRKRSKR